MTTKSLGSYLAKLAEDLEDRPDSWFNDPKGWLSKPSFKRSAQNRDSVEKSNSSFRKSAAESLSSLKAYMTGPTYNRRWFVLELQAKTLRYYKDDSPHAFESGSINLTQIVDVQFSKLFDAPSFSIDLISLDKHYTIAADSHNQILKWAYAVNLCRTNAQPQRGLSAGVDASLRDKTEKPALKAYSKNKEKWTRYDFVYEEAGPLMLNVMGTTNKDSRTGRVLNNWIIVTSFEPTRDGRPGRSELSGVISVKDYIVGVNGVDLTTFTFNDAMEEISNSAWPKTIHFLRDNTENKEFSRAEGWAVVYYPSLNRKRRRYIEIRWEAINFRKPAPGGSATAQRDAYLSLDKIEIIKPIIDRTMPPDQQFILRLKCKAGAFVDHVGADDVSVGGSPCEYVELCFAKEVQMKNWRSVLVSPSIYSSAQTSATIPVEPLEIVEVADTISQGSNKSDMAIKSTLTGAFGVREFTISEGALHWSRPGSKGRKRTMPLANSFGCHVKSVRAVEDALQSRLGGYAYQLHLKNDEQTVVMGMKNESTLRNWLATINQLIAKAPVESKFGLYVSTDIEHDTIVDESIATDDEFALHESLDTTTATSVLIAGVSEGIGRAADGHAVMQGYLYKKGNRRSSMGPSSITSTNYKKCWFILKDHNLAWFKSQSEAQGGISVSGLIDLRTAYEVRESVDPSAPENAIEIVTPSTLVTVVAVDEEDQMRWIDALADTLELREMAVQREGMKAPAAGGSSAREERIAAIRNSVVFSGTLGLKSTNRLNFGVTWKDRFFVIVSGALTYYEAQNDLYDEDKECQGEISLANILVVESTADPKCKMDCVIDIHARVKSGGDAQGMRIFTLDARTTVYAKEWMEQLCKASEVLELKKTARGFTSFVSPELVQKRNAKRAQNSAIFAMRGALEVPAAAVNKEDGTAAASGAGGDDIEGSPATRGPVVSVSGRGRGRGRGFGRGALFGGRGGGRGGSNVNSHGNSPQHNQRSVDASGGYSETDVAADALVESEAESEVTADALAESEEADAEREAAAVGESEAVGVGLGEAVGEGLGEAEVDDVEPEFHDNDDQAEGGAGDESRVFLGAPDERQIAGRLGLMNIGGGRLGGGGRGGGRGRGEAFARRLSNTAAAGAAAEVPPGDL